MKGRPRSLGFALLTVLAVWCVLYVQRRAAHQPNVDDYLYASTSEGLFQAFASSPIRGVHVFLHTGQTAPLVPLLAAPLTRLDGINGAVAVNLPLLLMLTVGAYLLARRWVEPTAAAVISAVTALTTAVLGLSQMLNFSVAVTAWSVWALAAYLHSDGFRRWSWSIATGVAVALLALSRTISPVYIAPLVLVMVAQSVIGRRRHQLLSVLPQMAAATAVALAIAGLWWVKSGRAALHWLRSVGYQDSLALNSRSHGVVNNVIHRARWTFLGLSTVSVVTVLALAFVALGVLAMRRHLGADAIAVLGWSIGCFAILATSANPGTGFGLPLLAVLVVATGAALTRLPTRAMAVATAIAVLVTVAGIAGEVTRGGAPMFISPVYRGSVVATGAAANTNVDAIDQDVTREIGSGTVVLARDDDVLNVSGLGWAATRQHARLIVLSPTYGTRGTASAIKELPKAHFLVTGSTLAPYHHGLDQRAIEAAARGQQFVLLTTWNLGAQNNVRLWRR